MNRSRHFVPRRAGRARAKSVSSVLLTLLLVVAAYYLFGTGNENKPVPDDATADKPATDPHGVPLDPQHSPPPGKTASPLPTDSIPPAREVRVQRVVDGDTLRLPDNERVRLIGIDTPESVKPDSPVEPFGPEAANFTKQLVEGQMVTLRFDQEEQDQYGRTLAYVYIDGVLLNELLIREGFSRAQLQYDYSENMKQLFRQAEAQARRDQRGIWSQSAQRDAA